jgi:hypothetical protein
MSKELTCWNCGQERDEFDGIFDGDGEIFVCGPCVVASLNNLQEQWKREESKDGAERIEP